MPWNTPITWVASQVVTAPNLNEQIRDNLLYLVSRPKQAIRRINAAVYTTTSTSFVNIDATNLSIDLTLVSGNVLVCFQAATVVDATYTGNAAVDFSIDGTRHANTTNGFGFALGAGTGANGTIINYVVPVTGLSVGSHQFRAMWRTNAATAMLQSASTTSPIFFGVIEV